MSFQVHECVTPANQVRLFQLQVYHVQEAKKLRRFIANCKSAKRPCLLCAKHGIELKMHQRFIDALTPLVSKQPS